jgi:hypothetical protein
MKYMHHAIIALIAVSMFAITPFPAHGRDGYRLMTALGDVKIITGKTARAAVSGENLNGGQTIATGKNSMADISLAGKGIMRIQENSKISVASLAKGGGPDLDMEKGGVLVIMSKLSKGNTYQVKTHTQVSSVRGTIFQVAGDESRSQLDVFTGSVMVNPVADGAIQTQISEMVMEGQSLSLDKVLVRDILAKKRKLTLAAIRSEVKDAFVQQALLMRETPEFKKLNTDTRKELDDRVLKIRQEIKERRLDRKSLKEDARDRKAKIIEELKRRNTK